ncbi:hypothetical protein A2Y85_06715 [candidate division WOR-3 bacterium RBG_13_43_14]|uniref:Uncharacterized protein n=1 Tax=candidate division WOR-3 bacterium RBG_13_43_14 TaxID=1802590 RepID=A0A1F4UG26_UNCW3|nr:MAG: hypothetical protein A2Y85_06715 [candidate division WOR-3 bacterium RBG_13_43_14]
MERTINFNNSIEKLKIPADHFLMVLSPHDEEKEDNVLESLFEKSDTLASFDDFIRSARNLLVIVNDASRPTPTAEVLTFIYDRIRKLNPRFLIATGLHPAPDVQEIRSIFGELYYQINDSITLHDSKNSDDLVDLGTSRHNTSLTVNKLVTEADKIITIGSIEPHYFAGYTGGRKSILPGVAGYDTIEQNHRHALHPNARPLMLDNNPVHEDMLDMIDALGVNRFFSIQTVMSRHHKTIYASCGDIHDSFEKARLNTVQNFRVEVPTKVDIIMSIACPPFDESFYQSLKAIENTKNILNENGIFILVTTAHKGIGPIHFARLFENKTNLITAAENALIHYRLGDHTAVNLKSITTWAELWCVTDKKNHKLENAGIKLYSSIQRSIDEAILKKGTASKIAIVEDGCFTVPILENKEVDNHWQNRYLDN